MACRLCRQDVSLLSKSHIIPDFMYQDIFDEKHRLVKFTTLTPNSKSTIHSSEYESGILCQNCDNNIIGSLESYTALVLFGGRVSTSSNDYILPDGLEYTQVTNIDYVKFKLFLLSMLWRASISSRPFFKNVSLGPYEEEIRNMILSGNPGRPGDFPCIISSYLKTSFPKEIVAEPRRIRLDGFIAYSFLIGGLLYNVKVIKNDRTDWVLESTVNESNEMKIIHIPEQWTKELLESYLGVRQ